MFDLSDKVASFYFSTLKKNGITCTIIWIPEISIFNSFHYLHRYFWGPSFSFFISHSSSGESNARTFWAVYKCICKGIWIWGKFRVILWTLACFYCHYVPGLEKRITWFCQNLLLSLLKTILKKKKAFSVLKKKETLYCLSGAFFISIYLKCLCDQLQGRLGMREIANSENNKNDGSTLSWFTLFSWMK